MFDTWLHATILLWCLQKHWHKNDWNLIQRKLTSHSNFFSLHRKGKELWWYVSLNEKRETIQKILFRTLNNILNYNFPTKNGINSTFWWKGTNLGISCEEYSLIISNKWSQWLQSAHNHFLRKMEIFENVWTCKLILWWDWRTYFNTNFQ